MYEQLKRLPRKVYESGAGLSRPGVLKKFILSISMHFRGILRRARRDSENRARGRSPPGTPESPHTAGPEACLRVGHRPPAGQHSAGVSRTVTPSSSQMSNSSNAGDTAQRGDQPRTAPVIPRRLKMLLPRDIARAPRRRGRACSRQRRWASSGRLVPIATRVRPITVFDTPRDSATVTPPSTRSLAPMDRADEAPEQEDVRRSRLCARARRRPPRPPWRGGCLLQVWRSAR